MKVVVTKSYDESCAYVADMICKLVNEKPNCKLGLATGGTPVPMYKKLIEANKAGKSILFEAQLGALRDVDFGIYPYTTSSNVIGAYAPIGAGIPGRKLDHSIGIMKAYSSCVGDGPFTAELAMTEEEKHHLREAGHEYGAATGRPRRVGPVDLGQPVRRVLPGLR